MKVKYHMWLLALFITLGSVLLPAAAQACWRGGCCGGGGVIYNTESGTFMPVASNQGCMVYRSVDDKYYPVARYGYWCRNKHTCYHQFVAVECQTEPGYWFVGHWFPQGRVCYYHVYRAVYRS